MPGTVQGDVEPLAPIRAMLLADAGISAASDGRIFVGEIPKNEAKHMPRPALLIKASGGTSLTAGSDVNHDTQRIDLFAYAATPRDAAHLQQLASRRLRLLKREVFAGALLHWAQQAGGFSNARDPDTDWPRCWRSYQIFFALNPAL